MEDTGSSSVSPPPPPSLSVFHLDGSVSDADSDIVEDVFATGRAQLSRSCGAEGQAHAQFVHLAAPHAPEGYITRKLSASNLLLAEHDDELLSSGPASSEGGDSSAAGVPLRRVLVLYIGGTIGMQRSERGWVPQKGLLSRLLMGNAKFHDPSQAPGTMPVSQWGKRVSWTLLERDMLLDSSDMDQSDWTYVAEQIKTHYDAYDGFVLIQGTDTLTYTASALSFMCRYLAKTVIVTGSQVPMLLEPNDAESNLFGSICIAGHFEIPEVCVFFNGKLMRGNRTTKFDASGFDAFVSQNYPCLLKWGPEVKVKWSAVRSSADVEFLSYPFDIKTRMSQDVAVLRLFPGISAAFLKSVFQPPLKGCVLMTYGAGNISIRARHVLNAIKEASLRGVLFLNITQCSRGTVTSAYATGRALLEAGVYSGYDMTCEAAVTKLAFLLGLVEDGSTTLEKVRQELHRPGWSSRGECSVPSEVKSFSFRDGSFVSAFVRTMEKLLLPEDHTVDEDVSNALFPVLLCAAAAQGDLHSMEAMLTMTDPGAHDYDGRTALHLAAQKDHMDCVVFLVEKARAPINALDMQQKTPFDLAIGNERMLKYLEEHGGHSSTHLRGIEYRRNSMSHE